MGVTRYSAAAHVVNVLFIGAVFIGPIGYCLSDPSIPVEIGRAVILLSFLLGAIAIADWYGTYFCNSFSGLLIAISIGTVAALVTLAIASLRTTVSFSDLALFREYEGWDGKRVLLRTYVGSVGTVALALLGVPRLLLLNLVSKGRLPDDRSG